MYVGEERGGSPALPPGEADLAFAAIYRDHSRAVFGLVRRICGPAFAAEVTQDVFVRFWTCPERFDPERGPLRSFLLANAHGRAIDVVRSETARERREQRIARSAPPVLPGADQDLIERERSVRIAAAVSELPESERDAIVSAFYGEVTYREAARILAVPEGTLKTRVRAGLVKLRRSLCDQPSLVPTGSDAVSQDGPPTPAGPSRVAPVELAWSGTSGTHPTVRKR